MTKIDEIVTEIVRGEFSSFSGFEPMEDGKVLRVTSRLVIVRKRKKEWIVQSICYRKLLDTVLSQHFKELIKELE